MHFQDDHYRNSNVRRAMIECLTKLAKKLELYEVVVVCDNESRANSMQELIHELEKLGFVSGEKVVMRLD